MKRRNFLTTAPLALAASTLYGSLIPDGFLASALPMDLESEGYKHEAMTSAELDFSSATHAGEAIQKKQISSVELTRRVFERIDRYNPKLNAFAYQLREQALAQAMSADKVQSQGRSLGVFHGVPVHVKEAFAVAGQPDTWGLPPLRDSKAPKNSEVVNRLMGAGAVLIGATNVPVNLSDWQSYNSIYGTTNNPWDLGRTPGGSSGGSAAALAAGLGYLSVGSDIGGSIRVPAHFCGIYGHKPTLDLVSQQGHIPGGGSLPEGFSTNLAVAGPLARSSNDLLAALRVLGGRTDWDAKAWKWEMPPPRARNLKDFRVGYILDDPIAAPTAEVKTLLENAVEHIRVAGATLKPGWPAGFHPEELLKNYLFLLEAFLFSVAPSEEQARQRKASATSGAPSPGAASFSDWQQQNFRRLAFRAQWQAYFDQVDVFLSPVAFCPAFPHDHSDPPEQRMIATPAGPRHYDELLNWIAPSTLTGCPATVAPIGRTQAGLPVGIQIMGPFWEDATTIGFAELLAEEIGGFSAPPAFAG